MRRIALLAGFLPLLVTAVCASSACGDNPESTGGSGGAGTSSSSTTGSTGDTGGTGGGTDSARVTTDKGPVQGVISGETRVFLGIPYAAPPVGDLRWKPPQAPAAWTDPLDASKRGPACAQLNTLANTF